MALLKTGRIFRKVVSGQIQQLQQLFHKSFSFFAFGSVAVCAISQFATWVALPSASSIFHNTGFAFGAFPYYASASTGALFCILIGLLVLGWKKPSIRFPLIFVIGGGLSNSIDRGIFGFVRDPIAIGTWQGNIADISMGIGIILLCMVMYTKR